MNWVAAVVGIVLYVMLGLLYYGLFIDKDYGKWMWLIFPIWPIFFFVMALAGCIVAFVGFVFPSVKFWGE